MSGTPNTQQQQEDKKPNDQSGHINLKVKGQVCLFVCFFFYRSCILAIYFSKFYFFPIFLDILFVSVLSDSRVPFFFRKFSFIIRLKFVLLLLLSAFMWVFFFNKFILVIVVHLHVENWIWSFQTLPCVVVRFCLSDSSVIPSSGKMGEWKVIASECFIHETFGHWNRSVFKWLNLTKSEYGF